MFRTALAVIATILIAGAAQAADEATRENNAIQENTNPYYANVLGSFMSGASDSGDRENQGYERDTE